MKNLYVFNPDSLTFVPAEWWLEQDDPTRAQLVGIKTQRGMLVLEKKNLGDHSFAKAQEVARNHKVKNFDHEFRCPTRRDVLDIQDAIDDGLHDLFSAIGVEITVDDHTLSIDIAEEKFASVTTRKAGRKKRRN